MRKEEEMEKERGWVLSFVIVVFVIFIPVLFASAQKPKVATWKMHCTYSIYYTKLIEFHDQAPRL